MESDFGVRIKRNTADRCPRIVDGRDRTDAFPGKGNITVADSAARDDAEVVGCNGRRIALGNADFDAIIHAGVYNLGAAFIAACNTARIAVGGIYRVVVSVRPCIVGAACNRAYLPVSASPIAARNTACKLVIGAHTRPINQRHIGNFGIVCTGCAACVVLGGRDGACHTAARNAGCFIVAHVVAARNAARIAFCRNVDPQGCAAQYDVAAVYACNAARALVCLHRNGDTIGSVISYARIRQVQARHAADDVPAAHGDACCRGRVRDRPVVDADDAAKVGIAVLLGAQCGVGRAVFDAAAIPAGDAARRALVGDNAVVGAALQLCFLGHTADDAARHIAAGVITANIIVIVKAVVIPRQADTAAEDAGLAPHFQAADRCRVAVAAVRCIADGQAGCCIVIADNAARIGVDLQIKLVGRAAEVHLFVTARQCFVDRHKAGILRHGGQNRCQVGCVRGRCQQAVIADDAARQTVGLDAARLCGGCKSAGRAAGCGGCNGKRRSVRANHRHVSADDTAHAKRAADFRHLYIGRGQGRGKVQADHTADRLAAHDLAADGQQRGAGICDFRRCIVAADQTADKIIAADDRADLHRGCIIVPCKHGIFAVAADQTAHIVRAGGRFLIACIFIDAQRLQQGAAAAVGGGVRSHAADAVLNGGCCICCIGAAPFGIVQARNAAHIGRIFAKARHKAAVGNTADRALAAVDRHDTAHIAVAQHGAAVAAAGYFKLAAAEAARHTADKAAAQNIALLRGAIFQLTPAGKAHQTADKITLERAVIGECAIVSIPALDGGFQLCFGHIAAGGAGAAAQRDIFAVARNAAEELAQHTAVFTLGAAKVVGAHADRTLVLKAGQGDIRTAAVTVIEVAHNAARKGAADDGGLVGHGFSAGVCLKRQVGGIHRADHTAHADAAPDRVFSAGGCGVASLFCKGFVRIFQALVLQQTGYRHIGVHGQRGNCLRLAVFGHGNAHEAANAARLVCIISSAIYCCVCAGCRGGGIVKGQHCQHLRGNRIVFAVGQGAFFQRAGVDAAQSTDRADVAVRAVTCVQRLQGCGPGQRQGACCAGNDLNIDLHIGIAQGHVFDRAVIFAHKADVAVKQLFLTLSAGLGDRAAAQLQVHDGDISAVQRYIFGQGQNGRPRHSLLCRGDLGLRREVFALCRAVDRNAAAGPVQAGGAKALRGEGVGGGSLAGHPVVRPAQVVQMAEIGKVAPCGCCCLCKQAVFHIGVGRGAGGIAAGITVPRLGLQRNIEILRPARQQAGDAVQAAVGHTYAVCLHAAVILAGAQQISAGHCVQRQDKVALVVAQGVVEGPFFFLASRIIAVDCCFQRHRLIGLDCRQLHLDLKQLFRAVLAVACCHILHLRVAGHIAAPAQGQCFGVGEARVLDLQLGLLQFDNIHTVLGRVVAHKAVMAAVVIAPVINVRCAVCFPKAQLVSVRVIKHRVHLPAGGVDLNADGRIQQRIIVDVIAQQLTQQFIVAVIICYFIIIQGIDIFVQLIGLLRGGVKMRACLTVQQHLLAEIVQFARCVPAGQGNLRGLEKGAGVRLVLLKPGQTGIGDQAAPHKGRQNCHDRQHNHKLHHREAAASARFLVAMHHRCSRLYHGIAAYSRPADAVAAVGICGSALQICTVRHNKTIYDGIILGL